MPLYLGGRSAGARVAAGIVCLAFPLHLPGRPDKSRVDELLAPTVPRLVLQGTNDSFGRPEEIRAAIGDAPWCRDLRRRTYPARSSTAEGSWPRPG